MAEINPVDLKKITLILDDVKKVSDDFLDKKHQEQEEIKKNQEKIKEKFDMIIRPILEEFGSLLKQYGHEYSIDDNYNKQLDDDINRCDENTKLRFVFIITPNIPYRSSPGGIENPKLIFLESENKNGMLKISYNMMKGLIMKPQYYDKDIEIDSLDEKKISEIVTDFMECIFTSNPR